MDKPRAQIGSVGFTGTRKGMTDNQKIKVKQLLEEIFPLTARHGCCVGADDEFNTICMECVFNVPIITVGQPSNLKEYQMDLSRVQHVMPEDAPLQRNRFLVIRSGIMIACPFESKEILRSGTWSTIRYAIKTKTPIYIVYPNGVDQLIK